MPFHIPVSCTHKVPDVSKTSRLAAIHWYTHAHENERCLDLTQLHKSGMHTHTHAHTHKMLPKATTHTTKPLLGQNSDLSQQQSIRCKPNLAQYTELPACLYCLALFRVWQACYGW
eukprot:30705-Amphidinium_carterae.1